MDLSSTDIRELHRFYNDHHEVIDFIISHKASRREKARAVIEPVLSRYGMTMTSQSPGYVRFHPPDISHIIYHNTDKKAWPQGEGFAFELELGNSNFSHLYLKAVIPPCDEYYDRWILAGVINTMTKRRINRQTGYQSFGRFKIEHNVDSFESDFEHIFEQQCLPFIRDYSGVILNHQDALIKPLQDANKKRLSSTKPVCR